MDIKLRGLLTITCHNVYPVSQVCSRYVKRYCPDWVDVIFVDNCSTDGTADKLSSAGFNVFRNPVNSSSSAANFGLRKCLDDEYDFVIVMANDHILAPHSVENLYQAAIKYELGLVSPFVFISNGDLLARDSVLNKSFYDKYMQNRLALLKNPNASAVAYEKLIALTYPGGLARAESEFLSRHVGEAPLFGWWAGFTLYMPEAIRKIGFYDEQYLGAGWEDIDYLSRIWGSSVQFRTVFESFVHHFGSVTTRKMGLDPIDGNNQEGINQGKFNAKWGNK